MVHPTSSYEVGNTLPGGYRVVDVKMGGMGVVYICHQVATDQFYAIKTALFEGRDEDRERQRRFRDEVNNWIRLCAARKHENIVQALLYNEDDQFLFLEYVAGLALQDALPEGPAHLYHAVEWAHGIATGMQELHEGFSLLHRDLKPQNVLIRSADLVPKVTDLGIGKVIQEDTRDNTLIGTPGYMAPETFQGEADFRSDIFSFGAVFHRMLTGESPRKLPILDQTMPIPSSKNPLVPPELDDLVSRCLAHSPEARPESFAEVLEAIEALGDFDREQEGFRRCETHGFYSPIHEDLPECLFCAQASSASRQFRHATTLGGAETALEPTVADVTVTAPSSRVPVHDPTLTTPASEVHAPPADSPGTQENTAFRRLVPLLVVVLVLAGGVVTWKLWPRDPVVPGPEKQGTPVTCTAEGCTHVFGQDYVLEGGQKIPQQVCDQHFICTQCKMRYDSWGTGQCRVCRLPGVVMENKP